MIEEGKWMFAPTGAEIWNYGDQYDSKEDAIEAGREYFGDANSNFEVGQVAPVDVAMISADFVLDNVAENVYEEVGEVADDLFVHTPKEDVDLLDNMLNSAFKQWMKQTNNEPEFYRIVDRQDVY